MVCYARPSFRMIVVVVVVVALLVFGGPLRHLLGTVEFVVAATAVTGALAVAGPAPRTGMPGVAWTR